MIQLFEQILLALRIIALHFCGKLDNKTKKMSNTNLSARLWSANTVWGAKFKRRYS